MDAFQDSVFYSDKSVTECELPELVVCYKESACHVVKDICIDDEKSDCDSPHSENDQNSKLMKESAEIDKPMQDVSSSLEENQSGEKIDNEWCSNKKLETDTCMQDISLSLDENESNEGIRNQCDPEDLMVTREMKDDAMTVITDGVSNDFTLGEILPFSELSTVKSEDMASDCKSDEIEQQSFQTSSKNEVIVGSAVEDSNNPSEEPLLAPTLVFAAKELDSGKEEATLLSPARISASEEATSSSLVNEVSDDSKMITVSIKDVGSSALTTRKDDHVPRETGRTPKLEEKADQPFSSPFQHGNGETSFSAAGPVTGLITYSGPIAYSGNLSLRSDSSTTSTRSFAFPILNTERNSSPVRMAKADRGQYQKHRGWRGGLLCCRF